jgi:uncharacterized circularly permuted ATP-grasp superfamily protein/uncharacterized alpha-E superfamily protein
LQDGQNNLRPAWKGFDDKLASLKAEGLNNAWQRGEDMLRENGISYNLVSEQPEHQRPWKLDALPALVPEEEWQPLVAAVTKRAKLWDAILKDCYGPRNLLAQGLIPPALLYQQTNFNRFLPPAPSQQAFLTSYAVDVARSPDGSWTVVADRTEAPNGMGFALENRIILSNVYPETSNDLHLIRIASFFQSLRNSLFAHAPEGLDEPRVVLLSPGAGDRTYFEDAYLARYLGITLAVGEELTVRNDRVYLKTVSGLQRVHIIYRRVHETAIDPLECATGNSQGVPAIMRAVRAGTVAVINPPGTGIAEAPAFLPFLPALSRHLHGEDLAIPSIETVWGGQQNQGSDLLSALPGESTLLKNAFGPRRNPPIPLDTLASVQRNSLTSRVAARPSSYVLQRQMDFSSAPVWTGSQVEARPIAFRLFLFANGDSYDVMPGGLVRCATSSESLPGLSLAHDSGSKDLWILGREKPDSPHQSNYKPHLSIRRSTGPLSSRAADNLYWIGRYTERSEFATRVLLESVLSLTTDQVTASRAAPTSTSVSPLLRTLAEFSYLSPEEAADQGETPSPEAIANLLAPVFFECRARPEDSGLQSLPLTLANLSRLVSLSRDRLSNESWRIIREQGSLLRSQPPNTIVSLRSIFQKALLNHSAFNGTCRENITRTQGWLFLNIGRRVERINWLLTLLEEMFATDAALPPGLLETALSVNDTTLTYRFRYRGTPQARPALDLLLFDPSNPRSLAFLLRELDTNLRALPSTAGDADVVRPAHRIILRALLYLQTEPPSTDEDVAESDELERLSSFVSNLKKEIPVFTEQLGYEFFTHVGFTTS